MNRPGAGLLLYFAALIAIGTALLKLPASVRPGQFLTWFDALFTIVSGACVTGLTTRPVAPLFTGFGRTVVGLSMQLGGLGIMIFASVLVMRPRRPARFIGLIVLAVIGIELVGAMLLMPLWDGSVDRWDRFGHSFFYSISAFCQSGFDLTGDSLESIRYRLPTHAVMLPLIVVGGLGIPVLADLCRGRLSRHTKMVLATTAVLYLVGGAAICAGQLMPHLYELLQQGVTAHAERPDPVTVGRLAGAVADASFWSATTRSAGFRAMPLDELEPAGRFAVMALMAAGGSPGSASGGLTTTVVAVLVLSTAAAVRNRPPSLAMPAALVRKAAVIAVGFAALIGAATWFLSLSEPYSFEVVLFEVLGAATTTGLSLGITGDLTVFGQAVIIATMLLGRLGPLVLLGVVAFEWGSGEGVTG